MRARTRRAFAALALSAVPLVVTASVAGAAAPPKFQLTVTDDFSNGVNFVVGAV